MLTSLVPHQGAPACDVHRRLSVAKLIYEQWTAQGSDPACLAHRYLDGALDALDTYVIASQDGQVATCNEIRPAPGGIPTRHAAVLSYEAFAREYMALNLPVTIQGVTEGWRACEEWVTPDGEVDLERMVSLFGEARIRATPSDRSLEAYGGGQAQEMTLAEYASWWRCHKAGEADARQLLYLKDWHFASEFPGYQAYTTPTYFRDDWLNEYYDMRQASHAEASGSSREQQDIATSDYRFVYLGPAGTFTPLHADVLRSFSWSVNVAGRKRWKLLPPEHTPLLYDRFGRELAPRFDLAGAAAERFPNLAAARAHVIEVTQGTGEAIFVPSGWHHTVENEEDTLSINHNWLNGHNLSWAWALLRRERSDAAAAIEDCREGCTAGEFEGLVQRNMAANCGLGYRAAAEFVGCIVARELGLISQQECCSSCSADEQCAGPHFNLKRALPMLEGLHAGLRSMSCSRAEPGASEELQGEREDSVGRLDKVTAADLLTCGDDVRFLQLLEHLVHQARAAVAGTDSVTCVS